MLAVKTFYSYDEAGNVAWTAHSDLNGYGKKISYSYDLQGNVTGKTYTDYYLGSSTVSITHSYDKAGRLSTVKSKYRATSFTQEAEYQYFASGKLNRKQTHDFRYKVKNADNEAQWNADDADWTDFHGLNCKKIMQERIYLKEEADSQAKA